MIIFDMEAIPRGDLSEQLILFRQSSLELKTIDGRLKDPTKRAENIKKVREANDLMIKTMCDRDGLDVDYAQIIAIGYLRDSIPAIGTTKEMSEVQLLEKFSNILSEEKGPVVGYNIGGYDIPLLKRRCMNHGIEFPPVMKQRPIDIMWELCEWKKVKSKKQIEVAMSLGMQLDMNVAQASSIHEKYIEGDWDFIKTHLKQDVYMSEFIYNKMIDAGILDKPFKDQSGYITTK